MSSKMLKLVLVLSIVSSFFSCSKDDDNDDSNNDSGAADITVALPADRLTSYSGILFYETVEGDVTETLTGTATLSGNRNNYTVSFNNGVPNISGITFILVDGKYIYTNPNDNGEGVIVEGTSLAVDMTINGNHTEFLDK